jgi:hypothetical protein
MIWVTWKQQRIETLIGGGVLALAALFLLKTGLDMSSAFGSMGLAGCLAQPHPSISCGLNLDAFQSQFAALEYPLYLGLIFMPLLLGLLLAAPFVLELEQGSYRLAWTQSITRERWLLAKLGLIVTGAILAGAALAAVTTWWWTPLTQTGDRLNRNPFELIGVVPIAYTVFAVALCLAAGTLLRRTVAAVGITLAGFLGLRLWIETPQVRYHFLAPLTKTVPLGDDTALARGDYIVDSNVRIPQAILRACGATDPQGVPAAASTRACLAHHGAVQVLTYQTADRFWIFQGIESAIFIGLSAALFGLTIWWVRRRIA